jgi:hypothetical protein
MIFSSKKHPKFREVMASKSSSRIKILVGSAFMSVAVIFHQSSLELTIGFALVSAGIFFWDINSQTKSGVEIEKKFEKLEERIKDLENENNIKSDNQ